MMTHSPFDRRHFLKASLLGGVALAAPSLGLPRALAASAEPGPIKTLASRVALTHGEDRADLAFQGLKVFAKEIAAAIGDKRVIIKPNNVAVNIPLSASDARNLEGILEFLKSIGKTNVVIAESAASGPTMMGFDNYGYVKLAAQYGAKLMDLDTDETDTLYCIDEKDFRPHPCRMARTLLDPDSFIISAAKFKTHDRIVATLSLKNIVVGAPVKEKGAGWGGPWARRGAKNDKPITHGGGFRGINYNLYTLASRLHPHLAVIDGYEGMEGDGPTGGTPVDQRVCVVSPDWLAADRVALELMGIDFAKVGYLNFCAQAGMGEADLKKIEIAGPALKDHIRPYKLSRNIEKQLSWMHPVAG